MRRKCGVDLEVNGNVIKCSVELLRGVVPFRRKKGSCRLRAVDSIDAFGAGDAFWRVRVSKRWNGAECYCK